MSRRKEAPEAPTAKRRRVMETEPQPDLLARLPNELLFEIMSQIEDHETLHKFSVVTSRTHTLLSRFPIIYETVHRSVFRGWDQITKDRLLVLAAHRGKLNFTRWMVVEGADATAWRSAALCEAAEDNNLEIMKVLIDAGANAKFLDSRILVRAASAGALEYVNVLLAGGIDPRAGRSAALRMAAFRFHKEVVKVLLDAGADATGQNSWVLRCLKEDTTAAAEASHLMGIFKEQLKNKLQED